MRQLERNHRRAVEWVGDRPARMSPASSPAYAGSRPAHARRLNVLESVAPKPPEDRRRLVCACMKRLRLSIDVDCCRKVAACECAAANERDERCLFVSEVKPAPAEESPVSPESSGLLLLACPCSLESTLLPLRGRSNSDVDRRPRSSALIAATEPVPVEENRLVLAGGPPVARRVLMVWPSFTLLTPKRPLWREFRRRTESGRLLSTICVGCSIGGYDRFSPGFPLSQLILSFFWPQATINYPTSGRPVHS